MEHVLLLSEIHPGSPNALGSLNTARAAENNVIMPTSLDSPVLEIGCGLVIDLRICRTALSTSALCGLTRLNALCFCLAMQHICNNSPGVFRPQAGSTLLAQFMRQLFASCRLQ